MALVYGQTCYYKFQSEKFSVFWVLNYWEDERNY
jgi:hypothetical protein